MARPCVIAKCHNLVSDRSRFQECQGCRNVYRYWYAKDTTDLIARQETLEKWQDRMIRLVNYPRGKKHARAIRLIKAARR
jgi:hypothetical protein